MKLETTVRRLPCKLTEAFHNYFAVGNLTKCRVLGLENISFREYAAQPMKHGERPLAPLGCLDRVYDCPDHTGKIILEDPVMTVPSRWRGNMPLPSSSGTLANRARRTWRTWERIPGTNSFVWKRGMPHPVPFILLRDSPIPCARRFQ